MLRRQLALCSFAVAAMFLVLPLAAWAAGVGTGRDPVYDLVMKFVNFFILFGALFYFLRKPIGQALADRREGIRKELQEALEAKEAAEAKYEEYKERVANLEQEIAKLRSDFQEEGQRQQAQIVAEAKQAGTALQRQAERTGENEVARARTQLRAEVAELAVRLAEELLAKAYGKQDQKKAVELTIKNVEGLH